MTRAEDWPPENPNTDHDDGQGNPLEGENEGLDYYLTGKDLKILFCLDDVVIDYAEPEVTKFVTAQGGFYEFFVKGKLKRIKSGDNKNYDIVVLANTKGMLQFNQEHLNNLVGSREDAIYPGLIFDFVGRKGIAGVPDINDIANKFTENNFAKSSPDDVTANNTAARVPMWGRVAGKPLNDGTIIEVPIMRSLAKIRIELDKNGTGLYNASIYQIKMVGASTKGTLMPRDAHNKTSDNITGWFPDYKNQQKSQNIPDGAQHNELPLNFYGPKTVGDHKYFYIYAPETVNNSGQFYFNVTIKRTYGGGEDDIYTTYRMNFGKYDPVSHQGQYMPVMRNHYYMIKITGIVQEQLIYIDPWDIEVLPPIMM